MIEQTVMTAEQDEPIRVNITEEIFVIDTPTCPITTYKFSTNNLPFDNSKPISKLAAYNFEIDGDELVINPTVNGLFNIWMIAETDSMVFATQEF